MTNKPTYNLEDVRRYLEGRLSRVEMHALEKAALEDPFLADALEGMQSFGNAEQFSRDVEHLKDRLKKRIGRTSEPFATKHLWVKIAAVLFVVVTGVAIIVITAEKNTTQNSQLARTEKEELNVVTRDSFRQKQDSPIAFADQNAVDALQNDSIPPRPTGKPLEPRAKSSAKKKVKEEDQPQPLNEVDIPVTTQADAVTTEASPQKPAAARAEAREMPAAADTAFAQVVIIGSGTTKNRVAAGSKGVAVDRKIRNVLPATGWDEFEKYLNESFNINTSDSTLNGEEQLTFRIDDNGTPESIKILKSLSPAHDREAIRLLREGPTWKVPQGANKNITLKLIF